MSEAIKSFCATLTPEQRRARTAKAVSVAKETVSKEQKREIAKLGAAAVHNAPEAHRKARIAKMAESLRARESRLTEQERRKRSEAGKVGGSRSQALRTREQRLAAGKKQSATWAAKALARALNGAVEVYREAQARMGSERALIFAGGYLYSKIDAEIFDQGGAEQLRNMCSRSHATYVETRP
jgi:hypothetical protein